MEWPTEDTRPSFCSHSWRALDLFLKPDTSHTSVPHSIHAHSQQSGKLPINVLKNHSLLNRLTYWIQQNTLVLVTFYMTTYLHFFPPSRTGVISSDLPQSVFSLSSLPFCNSPQTARLLLWSTDYVCLRGGRKGIRFTGITERIGIGSEEIAWLKKKCTSAIGQRFKKKGWGSVLYYSGGTGWGVEERENSRGKAAYADNTMCLRKIRFHCWVYPPQYDSQ